MVRKFLGLGKSWCESGPQESHNKKNTGSAHMKNRFRNTVLFIAGSIVVAALLGAPSTARAADLGALLVSVQAGGDIR
jgi:hypothetical protein